VLLPTAPPPGLKTIKGITIEVLLVPAYSVVATATGVAGGVAGVES